MIFNGLRLNLNYANLNQKTKGRDQGVNLPWLF